MGDPNKVTPISPRLLEFERILFDLYSVVNGFTIDVEPLHKFSRVLNGMANWVLKHSTSIVFHDDIWNYRE